MTEDQQKQEKYDSTPIPNNIRCVDCKRLMKITIKHIDILDQELRMMFLFNCPNCKKKRWIYEDGKEYESQPQLCPKCKAEIEMSLIKESKEKIIWKTTCASCGFTEITEDDLEKQRAERKKREEEDKKLLADYRQVFCSDQKGKEYSEYIEALKVAPEVYEEELKKYDSFAYQKAVGLKKLTIVELEKLLNSLFEKEQYIKLTFDNPQISQHVIVPFSIQDASSSRKQEESISHLQKIIKNGLDGTNWRLMSDGLSYRLGFISGRLKGYEREEDLFEISGQKKEEQLSKTDYETRMKYEGHHVIQFSRLIGQSKGIENVRKRRLKQDPEGFFLESEEDIYRCGICGENTPGNKTWWNLDGVRCADCQRNIEQGIISTEIHKNNDIWIKDLELTSEYDFDINPSTVRKLRKQGILHGRDLKREDGSFYFTVYMIEDNEDFLKQYPQETQAKNDP